MAQVSKSVRKALDTRELVYFLGAPDFMGDGNPLDGAFVTITIWHPMGHFIVESASCSILEKTVVDGVSGAWVAYYPTDDDFADVGTYQVQWEATYPDLRTARFPSADKPPDGPFALVAVNEALDTRAA